jgi:hypothetical protein
LAVLPGMSQRKHFEIAQLTPARWMASRGRDRERFEFWHSTEPIRAGFWHSFGAVT